jgi:hypothetical protein
LAFAQPVQRFARQEHGLAKKRIPSIPCILGKKLSRLSALFSQTDSSSENCDAEMSGEKQEVNRGAPTHQHPQGSGR